MVAVQPRTICLSILTRFPRYAAQVSCRAGVMPRTSGRTFSGHEMGIRDLQHPRKIRAPCTTSIVHAVSHFLWTVGGDFVDRVDHLCISTPLVNQAPESIAARAPALATGNVHRIEFADEITEDGYAVARH